jgi:hypothetical protein
MMPRCARALLLAVVVGPWAAACAPTDVPTADPEAAQLDPPIVVVEQPEPEPEPKAEPEPEPMQTAATPATAKPADPKAEVINFTGADADPGMADEVTGDPKRDPLPSMMSDIIKGPNK